MQDHGERHRISTHASLVVGMFEEFEEYTSDSFTRGRLQPPQCIASPTWRYTSSLDFYRRDRRAVTVRRG
ncbi:hypothetical protein L3Q82_014308 [Scortum barcoo]|uniref:Uncharacterized protein n=1 Tax=Scortum barcoo TaxID=214431 RepID=A0ACB8VYH8_9TELE|nr:hypothetical protein L3Q82_014308 [Scortum barcoo]